MSSKITLSVVFISIFTFLLFSNLAPHSNTSYDAAKGKKLFADNCSGCHGTNGEGAFGPNLTDNYFIHGHHLHAVVHIVKHGNKKGMTAFHHQLSHKQIHDVSHFAFKLHGTNVSGGKAPQGKLHK